MLRHGIDQRRVAAAQRGASHFLREVDAAGAEETVPVQKVALHQAGCGGESGGQVDLRLAVAVGQLSSPGCSRGCVRLLRCLLLQLLQPKRMLLMLERHLSRAHLIPRARLAGDVAVVLEKLATGVAGAGPRRAGTGAHRGVSGARARTTRAPR